MRSFRVAFFSAVFFPLIISVADVHAFWWRSDAEESKPKESKKVEKSDDKLVGFLNDEQESAFLELVSIKQKRINELSVLNDFIDEKRKEVENFSQVVINKLDLDPQKNYNFDSESGRVFLLGGDLPDGVDSKDSNAGKAERKKLVHTIKDEEQKRQLSKIVAAKSIADTQIKCLLLMLEEKNIELNNANKILETKFEIYPDKVYRYDKRIGAIYEVIQQKQAGS